MSSFNLAFFSGSTGRDRKQDAVMASMNARDNFLAKLDADRLRRQNDIKKLTSAVKIQRRWRRFRCRQETVAGFRSEFDAKFAGSNSTKLGCKEIGELINALVVFYSQPTDDGRLMRACSEAVRISRDARNVDDVLPVSRRFLMARCCLRFLNGATSETNYFMAVRYLETFVLTDPAVLRATVQKGYFETFFKLMASVVAPPTSTALVVPPPIPPPRIAQIIERAFAPLETPGLTLRETSSRFMHAFCNSAAHYVFGNVILPATVEFFSTRSTARDATIDELRLCLKPEKPVTSTRLGMAFWRPCALLVSFVPAIVEAEDGRREKTLHYVEVLSEYVRVVNVDRRRADAHRTRQRRHGQQPMQVDVADEDAVVDHLRRLVAQLLESGQFRRLIQICLADGRMSLTCLVAFEEQLTPPVVDVLSATPGFLDRLWRFVSKRNAVTGTLRVQLKPDYEEQVQLETTKAALVLFCNCLKARLSAAADADVASTDLVADFDECLGVLRETCLELLGLVHADGHPNPNASSRPVDDPKKYWQDVSNAVVSTLQVVYAKDCRARLLREGFWSDYNRQVVISRAMWTARTRRHYTQPAVARARYTFVEHLARRDDDDDDDDDGGGAGGDSTDSDEEKQATVMNPSDVRDLSIVRNVPFIIPFEQRLKIFSELLEHDKVASGVASHADLALNHRAGLSISVRRENIYEDAFDMLGPNAGNRNEAYDLRRPIRVRMINWTGANEEGVDGGGIFREFLSELLKTAFDANRGIFTVTHDRLLYPNPTAMTILGAEYYRHFHFLGRMLAKMIYEKQLAELRFAEFFIIQLLGSRRSNEDVDLQHMKSFDPLLFKHLRDLGSLSEAQVEDLQLDFSIVVDEFGAINRVELKPNGSQIRVTSGNVQEYVRLYVNYHLKQRIAPMVRAMRAGVSDVINIEWLAMFSPAEIQVLIAGKEEDINVDDFRRHCFFNNIKTDADHEYVETFWSVVRGLLPEDKKALLKFITGCPRPPIEGFQAFIPRIGIMLIGDENLLPTSATCMNMLKLPVYSNREKLEEKLRYAINAGAGFELA